MISFAPSVLRRGVIPPLVTPLRARDQLDVAGLERLVEHLLAAGVHGFLALGAAGEPGGLSYRLRRELISRVCREVAGRVPVIVGVTDTALVEAIEFARFAAECGAAALLVAPPCHHPDNQADLLAHIRHLAPELPLPLLLDNTPVHARTLFETDTVRRLMELPKVIGLRDSSGDMTGFQHFVSLLPQRPDWTLFMGTGELLAESILLGGHGGADSAANLHPALHVELHAAAIAGDVARVVALQADLLRITELLRHAGAHGPAPLRALKCALHLRGLCDDRMADPWPRLPDSERHHIRARLLALGLQSTTPISRHRAAALV